MMRILGQTLTPHRDGRDIPVGLILLATPPRLRVTGETEVQLRHTLWGAAGMTMIVLATLPMNARPAAARQDTKQDTAARQDANGTPVRRAPASSVQIRPPLQALRTKGRAAAALRSRIAATKGKVRSTTWHGRASGLRISGNRAMRRISRAGLGWQATGRCTDQNRPYCTSLHSIRYGTLMKTIDLKRRSGCRIVITGGTETGHAHGVYSHGNGYKVDIKHNECIDSYITRKFRFYRTRGDGAALYRNKENDIYAREPDHWDLLLH
ncbi:hypothetical protein GCM10009555_021910 [Acrocarpospora macrocephala]|uniref:Uncharacterized protein n=2 Tax=Acrocarpospora macrocephala TaxID=150177 RepID=A0A5M3X081_9ACTN|nr:hypothetical protein Amac_057200 [Acrocarpospora macrocephala]